MIELRHVRYFVATAEAGSVSAAADRVHVTQPSLSRQLRVLEHKLGVSLFERSTGRLSLSRTGQELLGRAREVVDAADALAADAAFHAGGGVQRLTIAAPMVTLTDVVSPFVATMSPADPVVEVRNADGLTTTAMLEQGADLAIGTRPTLPPFNWRELAVLPVWAYVPPDDVWASRSEVSLVDLLERPVIGLPSTFTAREALDSAVSVAGASFTDFLEAANGTIAQALAASGRGVAVVSDDARFGLVPVAVRTDERILVVRLVAAWDARALAARRLEELAHRLHNWTTAQYPVLASSRPALGD